MRPRDIVFLWVMFIAVIVQLVFLNDVAGNIHHDLRCAAVELAAIDNEKPGAGDVALRCLKGGK